MDQAQRAQRLDQGELAAVEIAQGFIAVEQRAPLLGALPAVAADQHPQILHRAAHAGVVQIHEMRSLVGCPQNVARVAVAMQAQASRRRGPGAQDRMPFDQGQGGLECRAPGLSLIHI